jgi:hypothetical protein
MIKAFGGYLVNSNRIRLASGDCIVGGTRIDNYYLEGLFYFLGEYTLKTSIDICCLILDWDYDGDEWPHG